MNYIEFPKLGWKFEINPELVELDLFGFTLSIKWYGVIIAVGFLLAMIYALKRAKEFEINPDRMIDVVLVSAVFAFLGARLYFVLFSGELSAYLDDPAKIFRVWEGGLAIYGGVLAAFLTALWMCRLRKVNTLAMFDLASLGFLIGQGIGRWGNFFNQEAFGGNTDLPWGMTGNLIQAGGNGSGYDTMEPVHPTFLYESLWCLLGLLVLHLVSKKMYKFKGEIFALYIMWYGAGRAVIEGLRTDSLMLGTIRVSQLLAILSVFGGLILFFVFRRHAQELPKDLFAEEAVTIPGLEGVLAEGEEAPSADTEEAGESDQPQEADASEETDSTEPAAQAEKTSEESADWTEETKTDTDPAADIQAEEQEAAQPDDGQEDENKTEQ